MLEIVSKDKLPGSHSYPVGAEALTDALGKLAENSSLRFECYAIALQNQGYDYRIISLEIGDTDFPLGPTHAALKRNSDARKCAFTLSAVKRTLAPTIRGLVLEVAIPYYKTLLLDHPVASRDRHQLIDFHFSEEKSCIRGPSLRNARA